MTHETLGIIAGVLALAGFIPYIYSIFKGETKPNKATWIIWTVLGGLLAFSYMVEGDHDAIWLPFGYFLGPSIVALLSFKYGYSKWTRLDVVCLIAAFISVIPWLISDNATLTLVINVLIDCIGALPTIVKTYHEPETEDLSGWFIFFIANIFQLFTIAVWNLTASYPIYLFVLAAIMVALIVRGKFKKH